VVPADACGQHTLVYQVLNIFWGRCLHLGKMPHYLVWGVPFSGESTHLYTPPENKSGVHTALPAAHAALLRICACADRLMLPLMQHITRAGGRQKPGRAEMLLPTQTALCACICMGGSPLESAHPSGVLYFAPYSCTMGNSMPSLHCHRAPARSRHHCCASAYIVIEPCFLPTLWQSPCQVPASLRQASL
jgi:hypothetical protein